MATYTWDINFPLEMDFEVECSVCDSVLKASFVEKRSILTLNVEPCETCLMKEKDEAYSDGEKAGHSDGYDAGRDDGKKEGFEEGYSSGKEDGYNDGYEEGILAGKEQTREGL